MSGNIQHIVKQLFRENSLENIPLQQLEELVQTYPSFSAAHYLLSKKLQLENNSYAFARQTEKTALYFSNPLWLHWLLKNADNKKAPAVFSPVPVAEIPVFVEETIAPAAEIITPVEETTVPVAQAPEEVSIPEAQAAELPVTEAHAMDANIEKTLLQQTADASKSVQEATAFEPYHTIDYFASQGIKFVQEMNPGDKLGRQLKSFTEWLKTMKRLPQKTERSIGDEAVDPGIAISAAHSIEDKEVLTETMAEVLIKQGKTEKAAEVYRKLSLLFPDKSVYFAARIEQLKAD